MTILIKELSDQEFQVTVKEKNLKNHNAPLSDDTHQKLTNGKVNKKELIQFSFKFLLARKPNTLILFSFELSLISTYFLEYIKTVKKWST